MAIESNVYRKTGHIHFVHKIWSRGIEFVACTLLRRFTASLSCTGGILDAVEIDML